MGTLKAPIIEIYSDSFITNSGLIETFGPTSSVQLIAANGIAHNEAPESVIITDSLIPQGQVILIKGSVQGPNDGSNPGEVSATFQFPDFVKGTFQGKKKTTLKPTQFSSSTISKNRLPSVLNADKKKRSSTLATRGGSVKKTSKKRSFFGLVTKD